MNFRSSAYKHGRIGIILMTIVAILFGISLGIIAVRGGKVLVTNILKTIKSNTITYIAQGEESIRNTLQDLTALPRNPKPLPGSDAILPGEDLNNALTSRPKINVTAYSYLVADILTGHIIIEQNKDTVLPIASITKLVTAVTAKNSIDGESIVNIGPKILGVEGNSGGLKLGEKISIENLFYPLLLVSSNDAAEAFALYYGKSKFIDEMNRNVRNIGTERTYFEDPSGLSANNISTAKDLLKIMQWIYGSYKEVLDITRLKTKTIKGHTWVNPTHFLNMSSYVGGKNGYTEEADRTTATIFSMSYENESPRPIAIIILRSQNRDKDMKKILDYMETIGYK
jgi:D-alanyl-D-alanine carboxypeptidase